MKAAIVVLSDPKSGGEDALGQVFNALASAYDFKHNGDEVTLLFQGAGTRWVSELLKADHPAHDLFQTVVNTVAGTSCGCTDVFGASEDVAKSGFELIKDNPVPGTTGLPSLRKLVVYGVSTPTFYIKPSRLFLDKST